ncbi:MAG: FkbM family methyltransferase [Terriglobia bacterium]
MKRKAIHALAEFTRLYFRQSWTPGREWLWNKWVRPYLLWRPLTFSARTVFGAKVLTTLTDSIQCHIYFFGFWEPTITAYITSQLRPGDTFVDIGANIGYHSLLASHCVGPHGRVIAFEPSPSIYSLLCKNLKANSATNVTARNVAVADERRQLSIFLAPEGNIGQSTTVPQVAAKIEATFETTVAGYPLGDLLDAEVLGSARFIKIDVEGAEWIVAKGIRPVLNYLSDETEILIEINSAAAAEMGGSADGILDIFRSAGFSAFEIENSYAIEFYVRPKRPLLVPYDGEPFRQRDFVLKRCRAR